MRKGSAVKDWEPMKVQAKLWKTLQLGKMAYINAVPHRSQAQTLSSTLCSSLMMVGSHASALPTPRAAACCGACAPSYVDLQGNS